jgi:phage gp46-like protein
MTHTSDGGEIEYLNGQPTMSDGIFNLVYLSLFGGNEQDSGLQGDDNKQWWGNFGETDVSKKYRSETQHLLRSIPAIPANMRRIEDAAQRDLAGLEVIKSATAAVSLVAMNKVAIDLEIEVRSGTRHQFQFLSTWGVQGV